MASNLKTEHFFFNMYFWLAFSVLGDILTSEILKWARQNSSESFLLNTGQYAQEVYAFKTASKFWVIDWVYGYIVQYTEEQSALGRPKYSERLDLKVTWLCPVHSHKPLGNDFIILSTRLGI